MGVPSPYERREIAVLLGSGLAALPAAVDGLVVGPESAEFARVSELAVFPALRQNGLNQGPPRRVLDTSSPLEEVARELLSAKVVIIDVSLDDPDTLYVLGLCHGLGRCPLLIHHKEPDLPFDLLRLRRLGYATGDDGLLRLRENLARAIRVFLASAAASHKSPP
jgi:hypothetical protein